MSRFSFTELSAFGVAAAASGEAAAAAATPSDVADLAASSARVVVMHNASSTTAQFNFYGFDRTGEKCTGKIETLDDG